MIDWGLVIVTTLTSTGALGVIGAVLGFALKSIFSQWLSRDLENYKAQLQTAYEKELDEFRSRLQMVALEHQIRFTRLHEKRADIIDQLYILLVQAEEKFASMVNPIEFSGEPSKQDKMKVAAESAQTLTTYFNEHRIYFDDELCSRISDFFAELQKVYRDFLISQMDKSIGSSDRWLKAYEKVTKDIPPIKEAVAKEFQKIIGISS